MLNTEYWNSEGAQKVFSHPVNPDWLADLSREASLLDLRCGYGRLTPGWIQVISATRLPVKTSSGVQPPEIFLGVMFSLNISS